MKLFATVSFWMKHFFSARNLIILGILALVLLYGVYRGNIEYKKVLDDVIDFKKNEKKSFETIVNYEEYSERGANFFFQAPTFCIYFSNPALFSELLGKVNSIIAANIISDCKSRFIFKGNSPLKFRFSDLVLVFAGLAVLLLGLNYFKYREFLRWLAAKNSPFILYITILLTGIILTILCFTLIMGGSLLLLKIQGIVFSKAELSNLLIYMMTTGLVLLFFFIVGTILGSLPHRVFRIAGVLAIMICLAFVIPVLFDSIIEENARYIPSSKYFDSKKLTIADDFEKIAVKKYGEARYNTVEGRRVVVKDYMDNYYPNIENEDTLEKEKILKVIENYWDLFKYSPVTFYSMTCQELSGRGYTSYLNFYDYLLELRRKFVLFWIDRKYYHDPDEMVNFIKGDENIFKSSSQIPPNYWQGFFIQVGYILVLAVISYLAFLFSLYHLDKEHIRRLGKEKLIFNRCELNVRLIKGNYLRNALYAILSGKGKRLEKNGFTVQFKDNKDNKDRETEINKKRGLVYIPQLEDFPGEIKVNNLLVYWGRMNNKSKDEIKEVLAGKEIKSLLGKRMYRLEEEDTYWVSKALLKLSSGELFLIDDIVDGISREEMVEFKDMLDRLINQGVRVIFLTASRYIARTNVKKGRCFEDGKSWIFAIMSDSFLFKV